MAVELKTFPAGTAAIPLALTVRNLAVPTAYRRYFVWAQIIIAFLFLEFALWEPRLETQIRWVAIATITILVLVLIDRPSLPRLGLRLPKTFGASMVRLLPSSARFFSAKCTAATAASIPSGSSTPCWD